MVSHLDSCPVSLDWMLQMLVVGKHMMEISVIKNLVELQEEFIVGLLL